MNKDIIGNSRRAVVLLAAYDYEALFLTLTSLSHTVDEDDLVVIILNGKRGVRSAFVENTARDWAKKKPNGYVVRPLNYGNDPYNSIKEVLEKFTPLAHVDFICKIDDDLIPLKQGWLDELHCEYIRKEKEKPVGFVTSLINNNTWGFAELLKIFDKREEYIKIMNYPSHSGEGMVKAGAISNGVNGTIWQYPYLARWCHEWTTLDIQNYINKTNQLPTQEISLETHYSIGCIFFRKSFWNEVKTINDVTNFDELSIHLHCKSKHLCKIVVMNQPMVHLYYFVQRKSNADLIPQFARSFSNFWKDDSFLDYPKLSIESELMVQLEELSMSGIFQNFTGHESLLKKIVKFFAKKLSFS